MVTSILYQIYLGDICHLGFLIFVQWAVCGVFYLKKNGWAFFFGSPLLLCLPDRQHTFSYVYLLLYHAKIHLQVNNAFVLLADQGHFCLIWSCILECELLYLPNKTDNPQRYSMVWTQQPSVKAPHDTHLYL